MTNKLCVDCKHSVPDVLNWNKLELQQKYAICARTSAVSRLSGDMCELERSAPFFVFTSCGKNARYFQAREPK